jgi:cyanate lyase
MTDNTKIAVLDVSSITPHYPALAINNRELLQFPRQ